MSLLSKIKEIFAVTEPVKPLREWFQVQFDSQEVRLSAQPPGEEAWSQSFRWSAVIRICFEAEEVYLSDSICFFTDQRPESYIVPTEGDGGGEIWDEVLRRGLFDGELASEAMAATRGLFCWPAEEKT
jgi:hypothetical protein